ncbi:MAG: outer membrane lipoprotein-sorting protein [Candidatus Rifleibacteriota bacterium]
MRNLFLLFFLLLSVIQPLQGQTIASSTDDLDVISLIKSVETQYQGDTSHGQMQMQIKTRSWTRTLTMESWSEGRDKLLTRILSPAKEKGTCTLKVNDDIWNYISRIDRLIKIPSSLMGDSWMGSHLTNDDLVKENKIDELYQLRVSSRNASEIEITGIPREDAAVVWGKIIYRLDAEKLIPLEIRYYDEEGVQVRTIIFSGVKTVNGRLLPMKVTIQPLDKPEEYTQMLYEKIDFDVKLDSNLFSIKSLRNR